MKKISVLGSTGSIGTQTLDVVRKHREHFQIEGLAAGSNKDLLLQQVKEFSPRKVSVATRELADSIRHDLPAGTEVFHGHEGLIEIAAATDAEMVVTAVVGSLGLSSTLAAIDGGRPLGSPIRRRW